MFSEKKVLTYIGKINPEAYKNLKYRAAMEIIPSKDGQLHSLFEELPK